MRKLITAISLILIFNLNSQALISYGIRGGLNFSSLGNVEENFGNYVLYGEPDNYFGYHIGATSKFNFIMFFVQPELLFTSVGSFLRIEDISENQADDIEFDIKKVSYFRSVFYKIDVPVNLGFQYGPLRLYFAPIYTLSLGKSDNYAEDKLPDVTFEQSINSSSFGYQIGAGLGLGNLILDLKYEGGLTPFGDTITIGDVTNTFDSRPKQVILSIGLLF